MRLFRSLSAIGLGLCLLNGSTSFASVQGFNIDGTIGIDAVTGGNNSNSNLGYGVRFGYHLDPHWEVAAGFSSTNNSSSIGTVSNSSSLGLLLGELNYHLGDDLKPLYFGIRMGVGISAGTSSIGGTNVGSTSGSNFAYGIVGGYDVPIGDSVTIGPKLAYTVISGINGVSQSDFQAHAAFKYFF